KLDQLVEGRADVLIEDGKVRTQHLKTELITMAQLEAAARKQGFSSLSEVSQCVLEPGGTLTFVGKKPAAEEVRHHELLGKVESLAHEIALLRGSWPPARANQRSSRPVAASTTPPAPKIMPASQKPLRLVSRVMEQMTRPISR